MVSRSEIPPSDGRCHRSPCDRTAGVSRARGRAMGTGHSRKSSLGQRVDSPPLALARTGAFPSEGGRILLEERAQRRIASSRFRRKTRRILHTYEFVERRPHENGYADSG